MKIGLLPEIGIAADCLSVLTIRILAAIDAAIFVAQFAVCQIGRIFVCSESFSSFGQRPKRITK
jgi:hypothetical protein